jgi:hypothetical protein
VRLYLDANVIVGLILADALAARIDEALRRNVVPLVTSDLALAEVGAVIARRVRTRALSRSGGQEAFDDLDVWVADVPQVEALIAEDLAAATLLVRRLDLALRVPDALHLVFARRLSATLLTFDDQLTAAARTLDVPLAPA